MLRKRKYSKNDENENDIEITQKLHSKSMDKEEKIISILTKQAKTMNIIKNWMLFWSWLTIVSLIISIIIMKNL